MFILKSASSQFYSAQSHSRCSYVWWDNRAGLWERFCEWWFYCYCLMHICSARLISWVLSYPNHRWRVCVSVCPSQGMVPTLWSVGWPITLCPYRDTGEGQPQAIWQQSLVYWLASHIWTTVHTTVTSLETEDWDFELYANDWSLEPLWAPALVLVLVLVLVLFDYKHAEFRLQRLWHLQKMSKKGKLTYFCNL